MSAPVSSKALRQAPALWNPKKFRYDLKECQLWDRSENRNDSETGWGKDIVCANLHVRQGSLSAWVFYDWGFVTTVENVKRKSTRLWIEEGSRDGHYIFPWMLSWDLFQDSIKEARGGSFPDDLVLRIPCVEDPLKASTELEWRMSMTAAEFFVASDHWMWCDEQPPTIVVCRAKEFRTLVDQGWTALLRKLKDGDAGDRNGTGQSKDAESDSTTDANVAERHGPQVKDGNSSTDDVADTTAGDDGGDAATETTTTTTIITTVAGDRTTTNITSTTTSTKRNNKS